MKLPNHIKNKLILKYRKSSIRTFELNIKRILENTYPEESPPEYSQENLTDVKSVTKYIKSLASKPMQKTLIAAILAVLKAEAKPPQIIISQYEKIFKNLARVTENELKYKEPTKEEKRNWTSYQTVINIKKQYKKRVKEEIDLTSTQFTAQQLSLYQKYLILSLYTYLPPLRSEEFYNTIIMTVCTSPSKYKQIINSTQKNIIDLKNKKLVSGIYKTSKKYGTRIIELPDKLVKIIKQWYMMTPPEIQNLLINPTTLTPMTQQGMTEVLNRIFQPKKISSSMLRKIYISDILLTMKDAKLRKKLALTMGHSIDAQEFTYSRFKDLTKVKSVG